MARLLRMPAVATGSVGALLREWVLGDGTQFAENDVLATVETDKAAVDIEADAGGRLLRALVPEGSNVEVGVPIAVLADPGEQVDDVDAVLAALGVDGAAAAPPPTPAAEAPNAPAAVETTPPPAGTASADPERGTRVFVSPIARRLAREAGLDLAELAGTGPGGRIVRRDVDAAIARAAAAPRHGAAGAPAGARPADGAAPSGYQDVPHPRVRKVIAARLTESQATPHFYLRGSARVDELLAAREQLNAVSPVRISVNDLLVKAAGRAQLLVPAMNAIWLDDAVRTFSSADISVAIATDAGVIAPVVRQVERRPISELATNVRDLAERARAGRLRQDELDGGALGISNLGMYGTEEFAAIINPPQSAILAVGAARPEPVVEDGQLVVATVLRVTLTVDHRVIDGAVAAEWMRAFVGLVEHPLQIFA